MGVNSLPKTVTRQSRGCDLNPGLSAPESSTLTTRLPSHSCVFIYLFKCFMSSPPTARAPAALRFRCVRPTVRAFGQREASLTSLRTSSRATVACGAIFRALIPLSRLTYSHPIRSLTVPFDELLKYQLAG